MKLRLRYAKLGKVRFTSHRDTARIWERAMRKAGIPVAISGGFTPRPRLSFGLALPTGAESISEYLDVELSAQPAGSMSELCRTLDDALPVGFTTLAAAPLAAGSGSLQETVTSVTWELTAPDGYDRPGEVERTAAALLAAETLPIERERKAVRRVDDVRPAILDVSAGSRGERPVLIAELATTGRGLRPAELAQLAFPDAVPTAVRALRTHQWIEQHDHDATPRTRSEVLVLPLDVVTAPLVGA